ncbi:MAG: hypothetical protein DLM54_09865 [Acidimicrobiales bacterium]|nr:MAG: hypothetical protein DLM54_09865 [Acidimicrobiales bacterium]
MVVVVTAVGRVVVVVVEAPVVPVGWWMVVVGPRPVGAEVVGARWVVGGPMVDDRVAGGAVVVGRLGAVVVTGDGETVSGPAA